MKKLPHVYIKSEWIGKKGNKDGYDYESGTQWMVPREIQDWLNNQEIPIWFDLVFSHTTALIFATEEDKASFLLVWGDTEHVTPFSKKIERI